MSELQTTQKLNLKIQDIKNDVTNPNRNSKNYVIFAPNGSGKTYFTKRIVEKWNESSEIIIIKFEKNDFINLRQNNFDIIINFKDKDINELEDKIQKTNEKKNDIWNEIVSIIKDIKKELKIINISKKTDITDTILESFWSLKNNEIKPKIAEIKIEDKLEASDEEFVKKLILEAEETKEHNKTILQYHNQISDLLKNIENLDIENIQIHKTIWLKEDVNIKEVLNNYSEFEYNEILGKKYKKFSKPELKDKWISSRCKESLESINSKIGELNLLIDEQTKNEKSLSEKRKVEKTIFNTIKNNTNKLKSILSKILIHNFNIDIEVVIDEKNKNIKILNFQEKKLSQGEEESILIIINLMLYINDTSHEKIKYLILDDPVTSIDATNLEYFVYMFNDIIRTFNKNYKFIILTHYVSLFESFSDQLGNTSYNKLNLISIGITPDKERDIYDKYINEKNGKFIFSLDTRLKLLNRELDLNNTKSGIFIDDFHFYFDEKNVTDDATINENPTTQSALTSVKEKIDKVEDFIDNHKKIETLREKHLLITSIRIWIEKKLFNLCKYKNIEIKPSEIDGVKIKYNDIHKYLEKLDKYYNENKKYVDLKTNILISKTLFNKLIHSSNYINTYESLLSTTDLKIYDILDNIDKLFDEIESE